MTRLLIATAAIIGFCAAPGHSQFFSACDCGDEAELDKSIRIEFMKFLQQFPVDVALRLAMQRARVVYPDPVYWAGFSVFGAPLLWSE